MQGVDQGVDDGATQENDRDKGGEALHTPRRVKTLVATGHARERRARSRSWCLQADQREKDRSIAQALAERSRRRKSGAYGSALSMLVFYINRAGKNLPQAQRHRLERAKVELKHQFGRE
jgi:Protein of unknown function (DUF3175)